MSDPTILQRLFDDLFGPDQEGSHAAAENQVCGEASPRTLTLPEPFRSAERPLAVSQVPGLNVSKGWLSAAQQVRRQLNLSLPPSTLACCMPDAWL